MARGLFVTGFTLQEVKAIQDKAKSFLLAGKVLMTWGAGETQSGNQFAMSVAEVLDECQHALKILAPDTYGTRITRTRARFY